MSLLRKASVAFRFSTTSPGAWLGGFRTYNNKIAIHEGTILKWKNKLTKVPGELTDKLNNIFINKMTVLKKHMADWHRYGLKINNNALINL